MRSPFEHISYHLCFQRVATFRNEILTRQECKVETQEQCALVPEEQCSPVSLFFLQTISGFMFSFKVTTTECKKQLSFRSEEKCGTKPDKECRIKTKIVQVPEEQIKLVCFLFSSALCHVLL